ncbi:MAG: tetratricopeptide repeat protein [Geothrix sp.]|uniref:O-linked N-acetylglucosamine transferase, SPINDLY family protein n=1 Tax=Geothrix sp. TaxID=1962974 RepID=UPI003BB16F98
MGRRDDQVQVATSLALAGRWREAAAAFAEAVAMGASDFTIHFNFGTTLMQCGAWQSGSRQMREALRYNPTSLDALNNLATALTKLGQSRAAEDTSRRIVALDPKHHIGWTTLGLAINEQGRISEGLECLRRALSLAPSYHIARDNYLMALNFLATDGVAHRREHQAHCALLPGVAPKATPNVNGRRIRVGYVSPDFRSHSVACFMVGVVESHERNTFEITCYSSTHSPDHVTQKFRLATERFIDIASMSDTEAAAQIERDGIDILVDLAGHSSGNRLGVFAQRPAPIQVTYLGYPATTGCSFIDYRLVDEVADPPFADSHASESLIRLPSPFLCYESIHGAPDIERPPSIQNGFITFGSFNHSSKLSEHSVQLWARLMCELPDSRLFLKARGFSDTGVCDRYRGQFLLAGIEPSRLTFSGLLSDPADHLASYGRVDIALDTFPYNGTTTTCEALWMGVPVLNRTGGLHAARVGKSILTSIGLVEFACESDEAFLSRGRALATDPVGLAALRSGLRQKISCSPVCDCSGFVANLEAAYQRMLLAH